MQSIGDQSRSTRTGTTQGAGRLRLAVARTLLVLRGMHADPQLLERRQERLHPRHGRPVSGTGEEQLTPRSPAKGPLAAAEQKEARRASRQAAKGLLCLLGRRPGEVDHSQVLLRFTSQLLPFPSYRRRRLRS